MLQFGLKGFLIFYGRLGNLFFFRDFLFKRWISLVFRRGVFVKNSGTCSRKNLKKYIKSRNFIGRGEIPWR